MSQTKNTPAVTWYKHEKSGRAFKLHMVANERARAIKRDTWPVTAVYEDEDGNIWTCPLADFRKKFVQIDPRTGKKV